MATKYLYKNKWVSLLEIDDGYVAYEETRAPGGICAFLGFIPNAEGGPKVVLRSEHTPAWTPGTRDKSFSAFTGGVEEGEEPDEAAFREAMEEAGIDAHSPEVQWYSLGTTQATKSGTVIYHLYAVILPNEEAFSRTTEGDGSQAEAEAENVVMDFSEAIEKLVDPVALAIIARSLNENAIWGVGE